jgi:hypothetical protein
MIKEKEGLTIENFNMIEKFKKFKHGVLNELNICKEYFLKELKSRLEKKKLSS